MPVLRRHAPFAFVFVAAAALMLHFAWHRGISSLGDDSVGYLTLAQWLGGNASPAVREWVPFHANFPPLFPLLLAATGGARGDFLAGHMAVVACAIASLVLLYRFAAAVLASDRAGVGVVVLFLLTPTAWIGTLPLLSETLYLLVSLGALLWDARDPGPGRPAMRHDVALGVLMGLAILTRVAGVAFVAAIIARAASAMMRDRAAGARRLLPLLPVALLTALWLAVWPAFQGGNYGLGLKSIAELASSDPAGLVGVGYRALADGWVASFAVQPGVHVATRFVILAVGALGIAGAVVRARRNALDGWYVLAALAMTFLWYQPADVTRRLLYPLLPVMLVHAALFVRLASSRVASPNLRRAIVASAVIVPLVLSLPALIVVHARSLDRAPIVSGEPETFAQFTEAYTALSERAAHVLVGREVAVVQGLRALGRETPPGARILWMRPDYVALLGARQGVPWLYREGLTGLARRAQRQGADYVIASRVTKADIEGDRTAAFDSFAALSAFATPVSTKINPVLGDAEFALMRIEPAALTAWLDRASSARGTP